MVGNRQMSLAKFFGFGHKLAYFAHTIEQREFGVDVEMGKVAHAVLS